MGSLRDLRVGVRFPTDGGLAGMLRVFIFGVVLQCYDILSWHVMIDVLTYTFIN